ncbi:MAG: UDP-N-acetylmuramoyl-L-alanine--D-glutamate ligase [Phycisphaerales bacterium]|nr:UDP-N-acetylmuramoyl-L-alanine--D-glutamate ligase [Phycisphaerales bacterium]
MTNGFSDKWLRGKRVVVMGLGRFGGGVGVTRFLAERGANVLVTDQADESTLRGSLDKLADLPVSFRLGSHDESDLADADLLVVSPAVDRARSEFFASAVGRGVPWTTEMGLFLERCRARIVGVTGTIGKSTTCAMTHAILAHPEALAETGAKLALLGGNIGASLLDRVDELTASDIVVLELSSFQLDALADAKFEIATAGLTNARPHHLERHGTFEAYLDAKLNLVRAVRAGGSVVLGTDDSAVVARVGEVLMDRNAELVDAVYRNQTYDLRVPGAHNQANAHMAAQLAKSVGVSDAVARKGLAEYTGLPHRLQFVGEQGGVRYYNDSKSTSADAVATALAAFDEPVVVLCGGKDIGEELDRIVDARWERVRCAICFGDAGPRLASLLRTVEVRGAALTVHLTRGVPEAVGFAQDVAHRGDVVLFSPACPSYDAFVNYEARGDSFCQLVGTFAQHT